MDEKAKKEIERIAYLNWVNRGQPKGDPLADWNAAYAFVVNGDPKLLHEKTRAASAGGVKSGATKPLAFPFGRPVAPCKPSANGAKKFFILGAYPSALHIKWSLPEKKKQIKALAVDNEPEPFWSGGESEAKLVASWKAAAGWKEAWGTAEPAGALNGSAGAWVEDNILQPLDIARTSAWITDCLDTYRCSKALDGRIRDTYNPFAERAGLPLANLLQPPEEDQIVAEALEKQRPRLTGELSAANPELVITLGNAAFRVFQRLVDAVEGEPGEELSAGVHAYGKKFKVKLGARAVDWLPLAHPHSPNPYKKAHTAWLSRR